MPVPCKVGESSRFRKTVSESDVYLFAGISGDFAPNHVDEEFMRREGTGGSTESGGRIPGVRSAPGPANQDWVLTVR